jgi:hypothetical protein
MDAATSLTETGASYLRTAPSGRVMATISCNAPKQKSAVAAALFVSNQQTRDVRTRLLR